MENTKKSKFGLGILFGVVAGVVAGLFASDKPGKQLRKRTGEEYEKIKKMLEERDVEGTVREIFGKITDESKTMFIDVKDQLAEKLSELREDFDKIEKDKYKSLVGEVVDEVREEKKLPTETLAKLSKYLESDFEKIKKPVKKTAKKPVKKTIKKSSSKK
jgi:gas vesicle protein